MKKILRKNDLIYVKNYLLRLYRDLFNRIDVNEDGTIDFNELLVLIAMRNQSGNLEQRLAFVFDLFVFVICCFC
jgi:Ca2+-binding EF-hand superfamily protein